MVHLTPAIFQLWAEPRAHTTRNQTKSKLEQMVIGEHVVSMCCTVTATIYNYFLIACKCEAFLALKLYFYYSGLPRSTT